MDLKFALCIILVMPSCLKSQNAFFQVDFRLHVKFQDDNITVNGSETTWAVGTANVSFTHIFKIDAQSKQGISYFLLLANSSRSRLCQYKIKGTNCTATHTKDLCSGCRITESSTERSTEKTVTANFRMAIMDATKNRSKIQFHYSPASLDGVSLQQFTISDCPDSVGKAQADNVTGTCGYGCTSRFSCPIGYYSDAVNSLYQCSPTTEWSPVPSCRKETTTTLTTTTNNNASSSLSNSTSEADSTPLASQSSRLTSAALIAAIGIVFMISYTIIALYGWKNKFVLDNVATLFVAKGVCVVSWLIAVGLLFGLPGNNSAYVAGTIVGSLSLVGMIAILLLHLWKIKTKKNQKGIPGKEVKL